MAGIAEERSFQRVEKTSVITEEMIDMGHDDLLEYCGQMYRRLDRIKAIIDREHLEHIHTVDSLIFGIEKQAYTEFKSRAVGYNRSDEDEG